MKSVLIDSFGPPSVLEIRDVPVPSVKEDELLVRVRYSSINPVDWKIRKREARIIYGAKFPMALGSDVAGDVVETGPAVKKFKKGDRVFAMLSLRRRGAYAEYAMVKEGEAALIPENIGYREAAAVPLSGLTAYQALYYKAGIKAGDKVLIYGASGGVGSFAVQIAKAAGTEVTGVCSTENVLLVESLGADRVIDYKEEDFTQFPGRYDVIFDAVGKLTVYAVQGKLAPGGRYVSTLPLPMTNLLSFIFSPILSPFGFPESMMVAVYPFSSDLEKLAELLRQKKLLPVIDREYTLKQIREAHAYSEQGHARGKIVIKI